MDKVSNQYKLTLEALSLKHQPEAELPSISFEFENHDNLFKIIEMAKAKNIFDDENQAVEFALGLKLFTEVVLKNRENPIFSDLKPAIGEFMKKLKQA